MILPKEYESIVILIGRKFESFQFEKIEALLLVHEVQIENFHQKSLSDDSSVNLTDVASNKHSYSSNLPHAYVVQQAGSVSCILCPIL